MEFRFRGRHEPTKLWVVGPGVEIREARNPVHDVDEAYIINHGVRTEVLPDTVSLTTGKFDCEGNEVFDGDIVECTLTLDGEQQPTERYLVEFDEEEGRFRTKFLGNNVLHQDDISFLGDCKIVGNRWETPELLEHS